MIRLVMTIALLSVMNTLQGQSRSIEPGDLTPLIGQWEGSLTYLDYSTNEPFTMAANLIVKQGKDANKYDISRIYPDEPKANRSDRLRVSQHGMQLDGKPVKSVERMTEQVKIVLEYPGKDGNDNKKAMIRETYVVGAGALKISKEVKFEGTPDWILRNEFSYTRQ